MTEFVAYPKTPRLFREVVITEKIDGTNGAVIIEKVTADDLAENVVILNYGSPEPTYFRVSAQSRKRLVTPDDDNYGFARWVDDNAGSLALTLGEGRHFGEWWGSGIQRGYGLTKGEKRFSLFNVKRWHDSPYGQSTILDSGVPGLGVVPVLDSGTFDTESVENVLAELRRGGSFAAPGYMNPEGVVVFHSASRQVYKALLENDGKAKGQS